MFLSTVDISNHQNPLRAFRCWCRLGPPLGPTATATAQVHRGINQLDEMRHLSAACIALRLACRSFQRSICWRCCLVGPKDWGCGGAYARVWRRCVYLTSYLSTRGCAQNVRSAYLFAAPVSRLSGSNEIDEPLREIDFHRICRNGRLICVCGDLRI